MTAPPLPASPCVRARLIYTQADGYEGGSRFYLSYSGAAPTGANCITLATDIATAWNTRLAGIANTDWSLTEVDVLDIASDSGLSGQWTGTYTGSTGGAPLPSQCSVDFEYNIARRYRGGKPRMYFPPSGSDNQATAATWSSSVVSSWNASMADFFSDIAALSIGAMGTLAHVNLSYYQGFTNIMNSSGRERAVPTYRDVAKVDVISGYSMKTRIGSQRRRRQATTA